MTTHQIQRFGAICCQAQADLFPFTQHLNAQGTQILGGQHKFGGAIRRINRHATDHRDDLGKWRGQG